MKIQLSAVLDPFSFREEGKSSFKKHQLFLLISAFLAFSMWFFVDHIWAPPGDVHFSDLYPRWYGARELLLHGKSPYSQEVTRDVQIWNYGRPLRAGESRDECRFNYPVYITFLFAPIIGLKFTTVVAIFRWILPALAGVTVLWWISMLRWRCPKPILGAVVLLSVFSFPVLECIYLQQPALIAAFFLAGAAACLVLDHLPLAGVLLAFSTIKPQITILAAAWLMLWAASDWRSRKNLIWAFSATMLGLLGLSEMLLPGWFSEFLGDLAVYRNYVGHESVLNLLLGRLAGDLAAACLLLGVAVLVWRLRTAPAGSQRFNFAFCSVLVVTVLMIPTLFPTSQILLLPAIFFVLMNSRSILAGGRLPRLIELGILYLVGWPLLSATVLLLTSIWIPLAVIRQWWLVPLSTTLLLPPALAVMFAMLIPQNRTTDKSLC
jgi:Glycosyltransferase family 87